MEVLLEVRSLYKKTCALTTEVVRLKYDESVISQARETVEKCLSNSIDQTQARCELNKLLERLDL